MPGEHTETRDRIRASEERGTRGVMLVLPGLRVGGLETNAWRLAQRMHSEGLRFTVASLRPDGPMGERFESLGIEVHRLPFRGFRGPALLAPLRALRRLVTRVRPDVVHAWNLGPTLLAALALPGTGVGIVSSRRSLPYGVGPRPWIWAIANRASRAIVPNSAAVETDVLAQRGVDPSRVRRVYSGFEVVPADGRARASAREQLGCADGDVVVVWLGTLREVKSPGTFVQALCELHERGVRFRALVAGDGPLGPGLEARVAELGLSGRVDFLGTVDDPAPVLRAADALVLTSTSEGLPTAVLEAMAHGVPVVASAVGGTPELVVDGDTGFLVPPGDAGAVAERLALLAADPRLRGRLGAASRARVERCFSAEGMVRAMEEVYDAAR